MVHHSPTHQPRQKTRFIVSLNSVTEHDDMKQNQSCIITRCLGYRIKTENVMLVNNDY